MVILVCICAWVCMRKCKVMNVCENQNILQAKSFQERTNEFERETEEMKRRGWNDNKSKSYLSWIYKTAVEYSFFSSFFIILFSLWIHNTYYDLNTVIDNIKCTKHPIIIHKYKLSLSDFLRLCMCAHDCGYVTAAWKFLFLHE